MPPASTSASLPAISRTPPAVSSLPIPDLMLSSARLISDKVALCIFRKVGSAAQQPKQARRTLRQQRAVIILSGLDPRPTSNAAPDRFVISSAKNESEFYSPQHEAAIFYGMFLRGQSADDIRRQIDIPPKLFAKWMRAREYDDAFRENLRRMYQYRKRVLAIFDSLVTTERAKQRWQTQ